MIRTGNVDSLFYVCTDHLGSITALVNENGTVVERHSYDAWGRERDPNNWGSYTVAAGRLDRGYSSHEHLREFGLINMNGRVYDPILGRMLSPDNDVQDPFDSQNYNRYGYCLNNPLKYTDPSGNDIIGDIAYCLFVNSAAAAINYYVNGVNSNHGQLNPFKWDPSTFKVTGASIGYSSQGGPSVGIQFQNGSSFGMSYSNTNGAGMSIDGNWTYPELEQRIQSAFDETSAKLDQFQNYCSGLGRKVNWGGGSDFDNWGSNLKTAAGLTFDWLVGAGNKNYTFTNSPVANAFRNSRGITQARDNFYNNGTTSGSYSFGLKDLFYYAGLDPIEQFVGSYNYSISVTGDNLQYKITNTTSFSSAAYHIWPSSWNWSNGPMGNTNQTYIFTEPLKINK